MPLVITSAPVGTDVMTPDQDTLVVCITISVDCSVDPVSDMQVLERMDQICSDGNVELQDQELTHLLGRMSLCARSYFLRHVSSGHPQSRCVRPACCWRDLESQVAF